jgi:hypothetical protein
MDIVLFAGYWAGFSLFFFGIALIIDSVIAEHVTTRRVGGIRFVRAGRLCLSVCMARRAV